MTDSDTPSRQPLWLRLWPIYIIGAGLLAAWRFGLFAQFSEQGLRNFYENQQAFISENFILSVAIYIVVYALATLFMVPGALWITIAGGLIFGLFVGVPATIVGATLGASMLFFASKTSVGAALRRLAGPYVEKVSGEFQESPLSYMFAIRFFPIMPFPVANILPAVLGAKYRDYLLTTALGIVPGVIAYNWVGAGVRATFADGGAFKVSEAFWNLLPAAIALLIVSLIPIVYKKLFAKKAKKIEGIAG